MNEGLKDLMITGIICLTLITISLTAKGCRVETEKVRLEKIKEMRELNREQKT